MIKNHSSPLWRGLYGNTSPQLYRLKFACFPLNAALVPTHPLIQRCATLRWEIKNRSSSHCAFNVEPVPHGSWFFTRSFPPGCQIFEHYSVPSLFPTSSPSPLLIPISPNPILERPLSPPRWEMDPAAPNHGGQGSQNDVYWSEQGHSEIPPSGEGT